MIQVQAHTTALGHTMAKDPVKAAGRIKRALEKGTEVEAAASLAISVRTLRRYRRKLEAESLLDPTLTPRGTRGRATNERGNWAGGRPRKTA